MASSCTEVVLSLAAFMLSPTGILSGCLSFSGRVASAGRARPAEGRRGARQGGPQEEEGLPGKLDALATRQPAGHMT